MDNDQPIPTFRILPIVFLIGMAITWIGSIMSPRIADLMTSIGVVYPKGEGANIPFTIVGVGFTTILWVVCVLTITWGICSLYNQKFEKQEETTRDNKKAAPEKNSRRPNSPSRK